MGRVNDLTRSPCLRGSKVASLAGRCAGDCLSGRSERRGHFRVIATKSAQKK